MKRTRILYVGNCLADRGGNPTTIDVLSEKLAMEFEIVKVSGKKNMAVRIVDIWWTIIVNRRTVDVILIDTYSTLAFHFAWTSAFLADFFKIPYIPFIHGGDFPKRIKKSPKLMQRFLENADSIITPSGYLKEKVGHVSNDKMRIIPNFLELDNYPYDKHKSIVNVRLLWVRALAEIYNPKMAIDVLDYLHSKGIRQASLTMVGPDKEDMKEGLLNYAASKGLQSALEIVGQLSKQEWLGMAQNFDCFVNTTTVDNTPVSVMEAMALGLPVISTSVGGIPFIINHGIDGLLVNEGDVVGMAEAICQLKDDDKLYGYISHTARNKALTWDWKVVKSKWVELLSRYSS